MTNGEIANEIMATSQLRALESAELDPSSIMLMTATKGGKAPVIGSRQTDIYKYVLTSRGSIYTREDIISYCKSEYGDCFTKIDIKEGYDIGKLPKQGIIRTLDVHISGLTDKGRAELSEMKINLLDVLYTHSPEGVNYRIMFE